MRDYDFSRRQVLESVRAPSPAHSLPARAQLSPPSPKRGGVLTLRAWEPPNFNLQMFDSSKTHILYSFTHSVRGQIIAGSGHWLMEEAPKTVIPALIDFLR